MSSEHKAAVLPSGSFLELAGWSRANRTSESLIGAQRGPIATSSATESCGKGKRPLEEEPPSDTSAYVSQQGHAQKPRTFSS